MKTAIIGKGFSGKLHEEALHSLGVTVTGIAGAKEDLSGIFESDIDAVHIATPPKTHGKLVRKALSHGKHVLCEKPLSCDFAEAEELSRLAAESGCVTALCMNFRYFDALLKACEIISEGEIGRPLLIHGNYLQEFHMLPAPCDWRYDESPAGSMRAISELGTHILDLAEFVSGERIAAVSAVKASFFPERVLKNGLMYAPGDIAAGDGGETVRVSSEDAAGIHLLFEAGAVGSVFLSEISAGRGNRLYLEISGEKGACWWDAEDSGRLHIAKKGMGTETVLYPFSGGYRSSFAGLFRDFYGLIESKKRGEPMEAPSLPSFADGVRMSRILLAVMKSAEDMGRFVTVEEPL